MKSVTFLALMMLITAFAAHDGFAQEPSSDLNTSVEVSTATDASASAVAEPVEEKSEYKEFQSQQKKRRQSNKKWFSLGVCVGQNLAQQGVVINAGQKLDASYQEQFKAARQACKDQMKSAAAPVVAEPPTSASSTE